MSKSRAVRVETRRVPPAPVQRRPTYADLQGVIVTLTLELRQERDRVRDLERALAEARARIGGGP